MAIGGILECFNREDCWFSGVVVTDGGGSPRHGRYRDHTDERMRRVRRQEQKKAAFVGGYAAQVLLDHSSQALKAGASAVLEDLKLVLRLTSPELLYTHCLTDKHDSHVAVALRVLQACREVAPQHRPVRLLGCEVWRDLDWLDDADKVAIALCGEEHLQQALLGVFDSQIAGGKRYDAATMGRRKAHATFSRTHAVDDTTGQVYAMDLTPLMHHPALDAVGYCHSLMDRFKDDVAARIQRLGGRQ